MKQTGFKKSGIFTLAGLAIGLALAYAVYDYHSTAHGGGLKEFISFSDTQNLLLGLIVFIPVISGLLVGQGRIKANELKRQLGALTKNLDDLRQQQKNIRTESSKLQGLLDQESGYFVDNWDQLVTEKDKLREEAEVSSALLRTALAIGNLAGPSEVLGMLAGALPTALFADNCLIFSWDPQAKAFLCASEPDILLKLRSFPAIKELTDAKAPVAIDHVDKSGLIPKKIVDRLGIKSAMLIPCVKRGRVEAIAMAIYTRSAHEFTDRDIQIATGIVNPATMVLENADLYEEIIANHSDLKSLLTRLAESQEDERRRFARDLHDGVIQNLSGIIFSLSFLEKALDEGQGGARKEIDQIGKIVEDTIADLRQVIYDLRPTMLDSLGLVPTLEKHLQRFAELNNVAAVYNPQIDFRLTGPAETALFRLAQEALNNIKKHAQAKTVTIDLKLNHKAVLMSVKDDGLGFDIEKVKSKVSHNSGFGLSGMRERVQSLNGDVDIRSKPGSGTTVTVTVPIDAEGT